MHAARPGACGSPLERISIDPQVCFGKPCIKGTRIWVSLILDFRETMGRRELLIPNSDRAVPATFLDDREPEWQYKKSPRATLAAWLTAPDNPFFARAIANRLWWMLFGIGLVDPVDDFHDQNPPSHPELLNTLAREFVRSGFDMKFMLRAICLSETCVTFSNNQSFPAMNF